MGRMRTDYYTGGSSRPRSSGEVDFRVISAITIS